MCQQSFFLLVLFFFGIFSHDSVIFISLKISEMVFFNFLLKDVSTFHKNCFCMWLLASLCIIFGFHSFHLVVLFLCRLAFVQSTNLLFTASSISLQDWSLFSSSIPFNVIHSIKGSINFYSDGLNRKTFLLQNGCQICNFISLSLLLNTKWYLFWYQFFQNFSCVYIQKHKYQLRDFAGLSKKFGNKQFGSSLFFFDSTELLQIFQETYEIDIMWHSLSKIYLLFISFCFNPFFQFIKLFFLLEKFCMFFTFENLSICSMGFPVSSIASMCFFELMCSLMLKVLFCVTKFNQFQKLILFSFELHLIVSIISVSWI